VWCVCVCVKVGMAGPARGHDAGGPVGGPGEGPDESLPEGGLLDGGRDSNSDSLVIKSNQDKQVSVCSL